MVQLVLIFFFFSILKYICFYLNLRNEIKQETLRVVTITMICSTLALL